MTALPDLPTLPEHRLSIVIPLYNEELCVAPMVARVHECLADYPWPWELIFVDDGSRDDTLKAIQQAINERGRHIRCVELARNFKQTAAMQAGLDAARGSAGAAPRAQQRAAPGAGQHTTALRQALGGSLERDPRGQFLGDGRRNHLE
ncbi:MAG: hypothetical protein CVT86_07660 [Alphaproteobacteria bacterium HGW-Alphaproteobacteria-8]|nr:MAG: hypothetical protein CVT86_07660 [Alphaproteobacteria bacterium HGW-Alphaproteobacteria-8]